MICPCRLRRRYLSKLTWQRWTGSSIWGDGRGDIRSREKWRPRVLEGFSQFRHAELFAWQWPDFVFNDFKLRLVGYRDNKVFCCLLSSIKNNIRTLKQNRTLICRYDQIDRRCVAVNIADSIGDEVISFTIRDCLTEKLVIFTDVSHGGFHNQSRPRCAILVCNLSANNKRN